MIQAELNYLQIKLNHLRDFDVNPEWSDEVMKTMMLRTTDEMCSILFDIESLLKGELK